MGTNVICPTILGVRDQAGIVDRERLVQLDTGHSDGIERSNYRISCL